MDKLHETAQMTLDALKRAGAQTAQVTVTETETHEFNVDSGEFTLLRTMFDETLSMTALKDQKKGSTATNNLDADGIEVAAATCLDTALSGVADQCFDIAPKQPKESFRLGSYEPDIEHFFGRVRELMETVSTQYPKIMMEQLIASHEKIHTLYTDTNGNEFETFAGAYTISMSFAGHEDQTTTSFFGSDVQTDRLDRPFIELGSIRKDLEDAQEQLHMVPFSDKFEGIILLTPAALRSFIHDIVANFASDRVILDKTSIWLDRLDQKVADDRITISINPDDPRIVCGERHTPDGFKAQGFDLIKNGVLKNFYISLFVANKSGAKRSGNLSQAIIVEGGETPCAQIIKNIRRGLIVGRFSGGQPGVNGDFSGIAKNSYLVENGRILGAVNETMINGNLAGLLNDLVDISSETVADGTSVLPYMAFDHVVISGK